MSDETIDSSGAPPPPSTAEAADAGVVDSVDASSVVSARSALIPYRPELTVGDMVYERAWTRVIAASSPPDGSSKAFKMLWSEAFAEIQKLKPKSVRRKLHKGEYVDVVEIAPVTIGEVILRISSKLGSIFDETVGKFDELAIQLQDRLQKAEKLSEKAGWAEILSLAKANLLTDLMFGEGKERTAATHKSLDIVMKAADSEMKRQIGDLLSGKGSETQLDLLTKLRDARDRLEKERKIFSTPPTT